MSVRGVRVWRRTDVQAPLSILVEKNGQDGSLQFQNGAILALNSDATEVERRHHAKVLDAYGIMGVLRLSKEESLLVAVTGVLSVGQLYNADILKVTNCEFIPLKTVGNVEYIDPRISDLQRLLSSGMFYFSASNKYDLISCSQRRYDGKESDNRFFWNRSLHFPFNYFGIDTDQWLLKCMAGSVLVRTVYVGHRTGRVALVSRLSCERVGTRFNVRGANHLGHVANFVETEQLIVFDDCESSLIQVRGSIPLFWEQPGVQVGSHKVKLRAFEASAPAYHRHMSGLLETYEDAVVVNLLGHKEGERMLAEAFRKQHKSTKMSDQIDFIDFDYHAQTKSSKDAINILKTKLQPHQQRFGFTVFSGGSVKRQQHGVLRVNCLDCLDRTNSVQTIVGLSTVGAQVASLDLDAGKVNIQQRIEEILKDLWQKNGDQCSTIYAGTGALDGKNKLKDASRSIARTIQNNLMDGSKQESFDLFLAGCSFDSKLFDKASNLFPSNVIQEYANAVAQLVERSKEVTIPNPIKIFVGTWNVNGGKNIHNVAFRSEANISDWIFNRASLVCVDELDELPDVVAIGVEELVDLNATNMMKTSLTNQRVWTESIRKTLLEKASYIMVACEQLVGVCLFLFVRNHLAPFMKDFSVSSVKTGMGGTTGNKGSVAFRMVVHSTSVCFVCSHFAAGQNEVKDRNEDYQSALKKIRFAQGRDVESCDVVFWLGDFNYRINLGGEEVKRAVANNQLEQLVPNDQLTQQKAMGNTFVGFSEGKLTFAPTYKYDTFSDDYDTSEKCRTPAWTDRVLWKDDRNARDTQLLRYYRSEIKTSDHRPVGSLFSINAYKVEALKCAVLFEDVLSSMGPPDGTILCSFEGVSRFPHTAYGDIVQKLMELNAVVLASKYEDNFLWIILDSGESALAALSMDGVPIGADRRTLTVVLKSPSWTDNLNIDSTMFDQKDLFTPQEDNSGTVATFEFDDDDEIASLAPGSVPDRPRPASGRSERIPQQGSSTALADLDWPVDNRSSSPFSSSLPNRGSNPVLFADFEQLSMRTVNNTQTSAPPQIMQNAVPVIPNRPAPPPPPPRPNLPTVPPRPKGW
ncbi:unnamed protein product [Auanema sp. JU1783]|nr:unnamed protein product [Auanema sp. JU1783]